MVDLGDWNERLAPLFADERYLKIRQFFIRKKMVFCNNIALDFCAKIAHDNMAKRNWNFIRIGQKRSHSTSKKEIKSWQKKACEFLPLS